MLLRVCSLSPSDAFCSIFSLSAKLRFSVSEEFLLQSLTFWDSYCPLQIGCDCWESSLVMFRLSSFAFEGLSLGDLSRLLVESVTLGSLSRSFRFLSEMRQEDANEGTGHNMIGLTVHKHQQRCTRLQHNGTEFVQPSKRSCPVLIRVLRGTLTADREETWKN